MSVCFVYYNVQNDDKMADYSTSVCCCMMLLSVLVFCESLPALMSSAVRPHDPLNTNTYNKMGQLRDIKPPIITSKMENRTYTNNSSGLNMFEKPKSNETKLLQKIELFAKKLFSSFQRLEKKYYDKNAKEPNVIQTVNSQKILPEVKSYGDLAVHEKRDRKYDYSDYQNPTNIKHTVKDTTSISNRQNAPEHRKQRQRRSFLHDYGLALSYSDDEGEVIFGAHTSPCAYADRHYCLNGGTCVFVGALEIKTCQCKIGYTGLRCQSINQEFLMALLSEEFFG